MLRTVLIAVLAAPLLFYIPGLLLARALLHSTSEDLLERHYERVVISVLLSGWLALTLAEFGLFSLWLQLALLLLLNGALIMWLRRRTSAAGRPVVDDRRMVQVPLTDPASFFRHNWDMLAFALVGLIALLLVIRPFETVLGARDAGVYATTGFAIAQTGSLVQHDALLAEIGQAAQSRDDSLREPAEQALSNFLGVQNANRYIATRMRAAGFMINEGEAALGRIVPQFLHLFPAWIALLTSVAGFYGGLFAPGLMGLLGAWSVGMLGRRLAGSWVGLLAFLLLALNSVQVWFARYSTSETTAQFLTFAGLYFFAKFQHLDHEQRMAENGQWMPNRRALFAYAALAGIAFGQLALTRIDFFLVVGPLLLYLLYCSVSRRWRAVHTAFAIALGSLLLHAVLHIIVIARAYFFDTAFERLRDYAITAYVSLPFFTQRLRDVYYNSDVLTHPIRLWRELALLTLVTGGLLVLARWPQIFRRFEALLLRWRNLLLGAIALSILVLSAYAYLVRPRIIDADILFNTRGGWNDPLTRDPRMVQEDVNEWRMSMQTARTQAGVVLKGDAEYAATAIDLAATRALRKQLRAERGPWQGPFSNQTFNWLRLQGYVGAPIALPRIFYDDGKEWWREYAENVPPGVQPPTGLPVRDKDTIPLANLVRVGWYLSPVGIVLGVAGFALWWWRGMGRAAWLFLVIGLVGTFFYVRQTHGTSDQTYIYILRRFVSITYPAFSLGMAYALVALAKGMNRVSRTEYQEPSIKNRHRWFWVLSSGFLTFMLVAFFVWTGRSVYFHTEYQGAMSQLEAVADRFDSDAILLFRGGGPTYGEARDVPDIVATPLRFMFDRDALTVKSSQPGMYAAALADQVRYWQSQGREVYIVLSASGANFVLPGFALRSAGDFTLRVPEFEQLPNQKPHNVAALTLPFAIYQLVEDQPGRLSGLPPPLTATDFAAQVRGFYLPEVDPENQSATALPDSTPYAWTNGDALLRLVWPEGRPPASIDLRAAGGLRPPHLGPASVCLSVLPESEPWPATSGDFIPIGCLTLHADMQTQRIALASQQIPPITTGSVLLRLESVPWIPAAADPSLTDRRSVGIQFGGLAWDGSDT